ncbi:MAG TPA: hypothetical protein VG944_15835 [Fimbriimonas sp.]|nr:hypothetical protein [Fimbriimonas sp.]
MTKAEENRMKNPPPMTASDFKKVGDSRSSSIKSIRDQEAEWARQNPEKAKEVNAIRAKQGKPPLGGS